MDIQCHCWCSSNSQVGILSAILGLDLDVTLQLMLYCLKDTE